MTPSPRPERFALIIGAMKSGTTSLFEYLAQHPAVAASDPKEPGYFSDPPEAHDDAWYLARWRWDGARHEVALEGTTELTKLPRSPDAPERVARFMAEHRAEARFVYLMRDPLERMESHLRHVAQFTPEKLVARRERVVERALEASSYATQLAPWAARFGRERLLLLSFDELTRDPGAVVRRVCAFLGIDPGFAFTGLERAHHVSDRRDVRLNALTRSAAFGRVWRRLPASWRGALKALAERVGRRERPYLTEAERAAASARLRPEVAALAATWGFDVSGWSLAEGLAEARDAGARRGAP